MIAMIVPTPTRQRLLGAAAQWADAEYAVACEFSIYMEHIHDPYEYSLAMHDALSKLQSNGPWLVANVPPGDLSRSTWRLKCTGLEVMQKEMETAERAANFRSLLRQNVESVKASTKEGADTVKCNKCGSADVSILLRQTRSADEGMSSFATCQNCGSRWKLN